MRSSVFLPRHLTAIILGATATAWTTWQAGAQDEPPKKSPIEYKMRQKLDAAAKVLEGLATEDAAIVHDAAVVLTEVSKAEIWQVLKDSEYRSHTQAFRSAVRRMDEAAGKSEFASAQLEWLDATKRCFDCHNYIRDTKRNAEK